MDVATLVAALDEYALQHAGAYPTSLLSLVTRDADGRAFLVNDHVPRDPWNREYRYEAPRAGQPRPHVFTLGADGQPGGRGDDADIDNWTLREASGG